MTRFFRKRQTEQRYVTKYETYYAETENYNIGF